MCALNFVTERKMELQNLLCELNTRCPDSQFFLSLRQKTNYCEMKRGFLNWILAIRSVSWMHSKSLSLPGFINVILYALTILKCTKARHRDFLESLGDFLIYSNDLVQSAVGLRVLPAMLKKYDRDLE